MNKGSAVRMEALDARLLLSASLSAGGTLTIVGTRHADAIDLRVDAGNPAQLRLSIGGGTAFFPFSAVNRLYVNGGRGSDTIRLSGDRPVTLLGGVGDDSLEITGHAHMLIQGEAGTTRSAPAATATRSSVATATTSSSRGTGTTSSTAGTATTP